MGPKKVGDDALAFIREVGIGIVVVRARPPDEIVVDIPKVRVHRRAVSDDTVLQKVVVRKALAIFHVGIVKKGNKLGIATRHLGASFAVTELGITKKESHNLSDVVEVLFAG